MRIILNRILYKKVIFEKVTNIPNLYWDLRSILKPFIGIAKQIELKIVNIKNTKIRGLERHSRVR